jgi:hypothetical protein
MPTAYYRLTVIGCAVCWLMLGLHLRGGLHALTHPGHTIPWPVLSFTALFGIVGVATLALLLRAPGSGSNTADIR